MQTTIRNDPDKTFRRFLVEPGLPYRDRERLLFSVIDALIDGWLPRLDGLDARGLRRAAYLVDRFGPRRRSAMNHPASGDAWLDEARRRLREATLGRAATEGSMIPLISGDPVPPACNDELAALWGLARGMSLDRYKQYRFARRRFGNQFYP